MGIIKWLIRLFRGGHARQGFDSAARVERRPGPTPALDENDGQAPPPQQQPAQDIGTNQKAPEKKPAQGEEQAGKPQAQETRPQHAPATQKRPTPDEWTNGQLWHQLYLRYVWGAESPDNKKQIRRFEALARERGVSGVDNARRLGEKAHRLGEELEKRLNRDGRKAGEDWLESTRGEHPERIAKHLDITLDRWLQRQEQHKKRHESRQQGSNLKQISIKDHHPNSLRHLEPAGRWDIYIDETGSQFDESAQSLKQTDNKLGRVVAVAVPGSITLPDIKQGFHANKETPAEVDKVLQHLLASKVGIFGFSVQDPVAGTGTWFGHIHLLMRWVLLQLTVESGSRCEINFHVEQNQAKLETQPLGSIANLLEGELQDLDAPRYENLTLSVQFMDKNNPRNGYVDAVAFTWGSPARESEDRLKKAGLLGHCLLRPSDDALERLYLAISQTRELRPDEWYELCTAAAGEPAGGILHHCLENLGEHARTRPEYWQACLDEVRHHLRLKQFRLASVGHALDWLERHAPKDETLPGIDRLPLETARLSAENHRGQVNMERVQQCVALVDELTDEAPADACEAVLRVAVNATNNFEFTRLVPTLEDWAQKPVAVPGLVNHGKLASTLGQLHAFRGEHEQAVKQFDHALASFDRLSDPAQAAREKAQTQNYRQIALMDAGPADVSEYLDRLCTQLGHSGAEKTSRSLAHSGQDRRFTHHLWLRALVTFPEQTKPAREAYLEQQAQWQYGEDHPWALIEAWRGWLLCLSGDNTFANRRLQNAVQLCAGEDNGPILWWMAEVLRCLAYSLQLGDVESPSSGARERLAQWLPQAPHEALVHFAELDQPDHGRIVDALNRCLPFNFH